MDTNIALASLASGRAVSIGAEYRCGVHDRPPGVAGEHSQDEYGWTPICFTSAPSHGLVESDPNRRTVPLQRAQILRPHPESRRERARRIPAKYSDDGRVQLDGGATEYAHVAGPGSAGDRQSKSDRRVPHHLYQQRGDFSGQRRGHLVADVCPERQSDQMAGGYITVATR